MASFRQKMNHQNIFGKLIINQISPIKKHSQNPFEGNGGYILDVENGRPPNIIENLIVLIGEGKNESVIVVQVDVFVNV